MQNLGQYCRCRRGILDYTAVFYFVFSCSVRPKEASLRTICFNLRVFWRSAFGRDSTAVLRSHPGQHLRPAAALVALRGIVKRAGRGVGLFLTGIFRCCLCLPPQASMLEAVGRMGEMLLPIVIAIIPVTVLVSDSAGRTTQALTSRRAQRRNRLNMTDLLQASSRVRRVGRAADAGRFRWRYSPQQSHRQKPSSTRCWAASSSSSC